jgi:putative hydrolase of the HAD superfamily
MLTSPSRISSIVFDLDGTLYTSPPIAKEIEQTAKALVAETRGLSLQEGEALLLASRRRLSETYDEEPTLTRTLLELGIEVRDFHRAMQQWVHPERYLENDPILYALLDSLRDSCDLYIYTNNNLPLARKILALLGVDELFEKLYTIEFSWAPKPDNESLRRILEDIGGPPEEFLFVGDRQPVDLQPADTLGISTLLVSETGDLLQIHKLLGIVP